MRKKERKKNLLAKQQYTSCIVVSAWGPISTVVHQVLVGGLVVVGGAMWVVRLAVPPLLSPALTLSLSLAMSPLTVSPLPCPPLAVPPCHHPSPCCLVPSPSCYLAVGAVSPTASLHCFSRRCTRLRPVPARFWPEK